MNTIPLARLWGLDIRLHISWVIILALIIVAVAMQVATVDPTAPMALQVGIGAVVGAAFLASATAHELAHAVVGRARGVPTEEVIVSFLGGAPSTDLETTKPSDEIAIAVAGPVVSVVIGVALLLLAWALVVATPASAEGVAQVAAVIGAMDLVIGLVNLIPAFPLDGGRIARGIGWARGGDPNEGLRLAARTGRAAGLLLAAASIAVVIAFEAVDGLMLALCGWLLVSSARRVYRGAGLEQLLDGLIVGDVMDRDVSPVGPTLTVDTFGGQVLDGSAAMALPVASVGGELLGLIGARDIRRLRRDKWSTTRAQDLMVTAPRMTVVEPEMSVRAALQALIRGRLDGVPVIQDGKIAGVVTRRSVADAVRAKAERDGVTAW